MEAENENENKSKSAYRHEGVSRLSIARLALLFLALAAMPIATATAAPAPYGNAAAFCQSFVSAQVLSNNSGSIYAANSMIVITLLLLLLMLNIAALTYLFGSAIKLPQLVTFGRTEIGEVLITAIIVFIFLGGFQIENSLPVPGNYLALAPGVINQGIFQNDCASLAGGSLTALSTDLIPLAVASDIVQFSSSINYGAYVTNEGFSARPLAGLLYSTQLYGKLIPILVALIALPLAGAAILAIFYAIAPLFLYLGIILRTIPFTRAAGGSFLGMFVAFYLLFPLLLYLLIANVSVATSTISASSLSHLTGNIQPGISFLPSYSELGLGITKQVIVTAVAQLLYLVLAFALTIVIAFDFMERAGDLLGAPSLASTHTLRNII
jgi:hypothetical protein